MTFGQQIISTFIGVLSGFILSIILFYLTEKWKNSKVNKDLASNLQRELNYNINFLERYKAEFEKLVRKVAANDKPIVTIFRFRSLQKLFIIEAFSKGLLYKYLTPEKINELDEMLNYFTINMDQIHFNYSEQYNSGKTTQQISLQRFEFNKDEIGKYLKLAKDLKNKLKKLN